MGYDSDTPIASGEVGKVGVAIDSIDDMRIAVRRTPARQGLDVDDDQRAGGTCCCSCTSSSPRSRVSPADKLTGTIQNDVLKEYIARGTYIFPPARSRCG
jgi:methylmalonyl-CoA mutase, N-terminal domain